MKRSAGNDASCLNLNHVTAPPLLGIDPETFIEDNAFSFSKKALNGINPWKLLDSETNEGTIYGIADQTVLEWGLKTDVGDTLVLKSENGGRLNIIMAAGLKSSVFQGYVLISKKNFTRYFPSVPGNSVFLARGNPELAEAYKADLEERLPNFGIHTELTTARLEAFNEVTNTYLAVFGVFGGLGMIVGIAGLGFVVLRNYNHRKSEFALMMAAGFRLRRIRRMVISDQLIILFAGISSGIISAFIATLPSLRTNLEIPWVFLITITVLTALAGYAAIIFSLRAFSSESLIGALKRD
jgi:ABC-type antimicrobial peptide transport system permease subunit